MADNVQLPSIRVLSFKTTYHRKPGKEELEPREWVTWSPMHDPKSTTTEMIKFLRPPEEITEEEQNKAEKYLYMREIWRQVEPAYNAWKSGNEIPLDGTPLSAWAGVTPEQIDILRLAGVKTIQNVANMTEAQMNKIMLPGLRNLKSTAIEYLASREKTAQAEEVADLKAKLEALTQMMAEKQDEEVAVKRGPGRPPKAKIEEAA
jgi:hypothetical protein